MTIDDSTVEKLAGLAKLDFEGQDKQDIKTHLNRILGFIDKLNELETDQVEPLIYMNEETNVLRADVVSNEVPQKEALKNGPKHDSDYFRVPKVMKR